MLQCAKGRCRGGYNQYCGQGMMSNSGVKRAIPGTMLLKSREAILVALFLTGIYFTSFYSYLLFHSIAELFAVVIALGIFVIAWNARHYMDNSYLLFIGVAFLFIGTLESLHTLAYRGMGVFPWDNPSNLPTQLWIATRYLVGVSFLSASMFTRKILRADIICIAYFIACAFILTSIFYWRNFPVCFIEGSGLTPFKRISEYIISFLLLVSIGLLYRNRREYDDSVYKLLVASLAVMIATEMAFTLYTDVYGIANTVGHLLNIISSRPAWPSHITCYSEI
jgi:hypothetical protein